MQDVVVRSELDQLDAEQGPRTQVERHTRGTGGEFGGGGLVGGRQTLERDRRRQIDDLHRHTVAFHEPRAKALVAGGHRVEGRAEGVRVERPA